MLRLNPDWTFYGSETGFKEHFGFDYEGEGLYCTSLDTLLVQRDINNNLNPLRVSVYNCLIGDTIFSQIHSIPVISKKEVT